MKIPVYKPDILDKEKKYVNECLDSEWISSKGRFIDLFETKFAEFSNINYAVTCSNGTVAIHLALLSLGIGLGDEVIVPTFTYIATVNAITYTGATPVFVDSEETYWQMSPDEIQKKITSKTKAILCVHLYGHPCEMERIVKIAKDNKLLLVEDCAEALGSEYKNKKVGTFGDIGTFSFYGNKTITTGEGGMVITNNKNIFEHIKHIKSQGLENQREYWHDIIGYNFRMTNICAAIGLAQLERIETIINRKIEIAETYKRQLNCLPIIFQDDSPFVRNTYWMNIFLVKDEIERDSLRKFLNEKEIETRPTFYPVHTMPIYLDKKNTYKISENIALRGVNLPSYPSLTIDEIMYICESIKLFFNIIV